MFKPAAPLTILISLLIFFSGFLSVKKTLATYYADCGAGEVAIGSCSDANNPPNDFVDPKTKQAETGQYACNWYIKYKYDPNGTLGLQATCQNWCGYSPASVPYLIPYSSSSYPYDNGLYPTPVSPTEAGQYCPKSATNIYGYPLIQRPHPPKPDGICPRFSATNPESATGDSTDKYCTTTLGGSEPSVYCCLYTTPTPTPIPTDTPTPTPTTGPTDTPTPTPTSVPGDCSSLTVNGSTGVCESATSTLDSNGNVCGYAPGGRTLLYSTSTDCPDDPNYPEFIYCCVAPASTPTPTPSSTCGGTCINNGNTAICSISKKCVYDANCVNHYSFTISQNGTFAGFRVKHGMDGQAHC